MIGSGDAGTSEMKFGGYEGAYSKQDKVQHFYEFTCRRSGILSRSYNETPLPEPCFNAQITPLENGWLVAMNIPFAAAGINPARNIFQCFPLSQKQTLRLVSAGMDSIYSAAVCKSKAAFCR